MSFTSFKLVFGKFHTFACNEAFFGWIQDPISTAVDLKPNKIVDNDAYSIKQV